MKYLVFTSLIALVLFGFGCLNYTKAFGIEHHYEFAERTGLPAPSGAIYWIGIVSLVFPSGFAGFLLGRRSSSKRELAK